MSKISTIWEVVKTSFDLTDIALFFAPAGGGAMIWGAINWARTNIPTSSLIWFGIGLFLIVVPLILFAISRFTKKVKRQLRKPEALIFPYIWKIDASQLQHNRNSVALSYYYPSALSYSLTFVTVRCRLTIGGYSTPEQPMAPLTVKKQTNNQVYYPEFSLGDIPSIIKDNMKNREKMQYQLYVTCWDSEGNEHHLHTEPQREMIALV